MSDVDDSPPELRDELRALTAGLPRADVGQVDDVTVTAGGRRTPCRVYRPAGVTPVPVVALYLHGGGWVAGDLDTHDSLCRQIVTLSDATLVAVDYPLAPERPYPAALDAALDCYHWVQRQRAALGPGTATALIGDSSGGNIAVAAALRTARPAGRETPGRPDRHPPGAR